MTADNADLQNELEERKRALISKVDRIKADLGKSHSSDWSEQAQERENDEVLESLAVEAQQELQSINQALARLQNGQYGRCIDCSADIPKARLQAIPEVALCVKCAALTES